MGDAVTAKGSGKDVSPSAPTESAAGVACSHCGLPVPAGLVREGEAEQFCCAGCETVWGVLHAAGLERYYSVREAVDARAQRTASTGRAYEEFDDPAFARAYVKPLPGGLCETEFLLEGVHCAACVWLIEKLPEVAAGVVESRVSLRRSTVSVQYRPDAISTSAVARQLDRLGYAPHPARGGGARAARQIEDRKHLIRVAVAGAIAGNVMLLAIALYGGALTGIEPIWEHTFRWISMGLGVLTLAWPGRVFFKGALAALRTRSAHLDLPIAIALGAGAVWGTVNTIRGSGEIYFDSLSVLIFLLLAGRWIQHRQQRWAADSVELMLTLTPSSASVIADDGTAQRVPIDAVEVGDVVEIGAGDTAPADGVVAEGESSVDQSLLTGESVPVRVSVGSPVAAGTTNLSSTIRVRVEAVGEATRIGRLMQLVADAGGRKVPIVRLADRVAGWFVLAVLALAAITVGVWLFVAGPAVALEHATALLIVACPCALGLATPMAMAVAIGRCSRRGVLVKDASALQALATPGVLILDKTGTITEGRAGVAAWHGDESLRAPVAALERSSSHPVARALSALDTGALRVDHADHIVGGGVRGSVAGHDLAVGSLAFMESLGARIDDHWRDLAAQAALAGRTPIFVADSGEVRALAELGDRVRADSRDAIDRLRALGWRVRVLSGDHPDVVRTVAAELGRDDAAGAVSPERKAAEVERLVAAGERVVMVGDGVNDAAALAGATVGIAVHGGAEASLEAADVYLREPGLAPIAELVERSASTMRTVRTVLTVSILYNAIAATAAMAGVMSALAAAVLMPASSFTAVAIAMTAGRTRGENR